MKVEKCVNGHFYDKDTYSECPHCAAGGFQMPEFKPDPNAASTGQHIPYPSFDVIVKKSESTVPGVRECPKCGAKYEQNDDFYCAACGTKLIVKVKPPVPPAPLAQPAENDNSETVLYGKTASPYLIRLSTGEKRYIDKPELKIGREKKSVDYCIIDNTNISRCHCRILEKNGKYCIVDANSRNHTYVNGMEIQSGKEIMLSDCDEIRLGNEVFKFIAK